MNGPAETLDAVVTLPTFPSPAVRRPYRVLVVDDELSSRQYVNAVLTEGGYATALAVDGPDALAKLEQHGPFDVLLTDLMMPRMRGDELTRRVCRLQPTLKVLYLTGYSDALFNAKPILWDDEAFLEKPCSPGGLLEAVSLLISGHVHPKTVWGSQGLVPLAPRPTIASTRVGPRLPSAYPMHAAPAHTSTASCTHCGSPDTEPLARMQRHMCDADSWIHCNECGYAFTSPRWPEV